MSEKKDAESYSEGLALRLEIAIKCCGVFQKTLAVLVNISENSLINYAKGKRTPPYNVLVKISEQCQVDLIWLLKGDVDAALCERVRSARLRRGLSTIDLAQKVGIVLGFMLSIEDHIIMPSASLVDKICIALELKKSDLLNSPLFLSAPLSNPFEQSQLNETLELIKLIDESPRNRKLVHELLKGLSKSDF